MTNIRQATHADLAQLTALFDQYRVFYGKPSDEVSAKEFLKQRLTQADSVIFVAESDAALKGFTQLYPLFSSVRMKKLWLLNDLYVNEKYRGQGVSVALIDAAKNLCRESGACGMFLETAKSNVIGNKLYPRTGFELNDAHNFYEWSV
jgi:ribosomal protein S18 acetylase RimI-like enzyme